MIKSEKGSALCIIRQAFLESLLQVLSQECYSSSHLFYEGTTKYMKNWVKESDKNFATIKATLCDYEATSYSGYWSPDNMSGY